MTNAPAKTWQEVPGPEAVSIELPPIIALSEFLGVSIELPEVLVDGFIRKRSVIMFASASKSFKTWTLLHLALCVSQGTPWFGRNVAEGRVLFLNFELSPAELQSRLRAIAGSMALGDDIGNFDICNLRGHATDIDKLMPEIIKQCEGKNYAMIIPDPIYSMMGERNENAANEMADFLKHLTVLSEQTGAAVVYTHHFAKGFAASKEQIDRASGSGVFARHADGIITLTRLKQDNAFAVEADLRSFKRPAPFAIKWEYPTMELAEDLDPTMLKTRAGRPPSHDLQEILNCLTNEGLTSGEWKADAQCFHGIKSSTFYELRKRALAEGHVEERDKKWFRVRKVLRVPFTEIVPAASDAA